MTKKKPYVNEENDPFWQQVRASVRKVESWPAWKRNAFGTLPTEAPEHPDPKLPRGEEE